MPIGKFASKRRSQYKGRSTGIKAMAKYNGIASRVARYIGATSRRQVVSIPAKLRAQGGMATELKTCDSSGFQIENGAQLLLCSVASASGGANPSVLLDMPIEGSSFYNRIARRTRGVALRIRGNIWPSLTNAATPTQYCRIIIVYDRQPNGALPSLQAVLGDYPNGGTINTSIMSGINPDNRDRFMVLRDRQFMLPAVGANGVAPTTTSPQFLTDIGGNKESRLQFDEYIKLNGLETQYKASTGGGIGDISTGSYLIIAMASSSLASSPWVLSYQCRYSFYD